MASTAAGPQIGSLRPEHLGDGPACADPGRERGEPGDGDQCARMTASSQRIGGVAVSALPPARS
jgi:hypothetical protein